MLWFFTALKRSLGQGNIFAPVCHSVHRGEYLTPSGTRYNPQDQVHPPDQVPPRDQVHPPGAEHTGRYGQHVGGMHPTGMQSG